MSETREKIGVKSVTEPAVLYAYDRSDHLNRLNNIRACRLGIDGCMRSHLVTSYIPGQFVYGDRPVGFRPAEEDEALLSNLRERRIGLIQLWSRWWDNPWGGSPMYRSVRKQGIVEFNEMAHRYGMKVLPYTSTNFFERTDPNFRPEWSFPKELDLVEEDFHLGHCSAASPGWRAHVLASTMRILDEYGFDGIYNDMGYYRRSDFLRGTVYYQREPRLVEDEILAFEETPMHDGAVEDMLGLMYAEVKRRGGVYKLHKEGFDRVNTRIRVYDYLWVGEAVHGIDLLREKTKDYEPYVIPEFSRNYLLKSENDIYLNAIPYMHFPVSRFTNNTGGTTDNHDLHAFWLRQYLPMVEEGTWAWLDIRSGSLFRSVVPRNTVVSAFANRDLYLTVANFGDAPSAVALNGEYSCTNQPGKVSGVWEVPGNSLLILKAVNTDKV